MRRTCGKPNEIELTAAHGLFYCFLSRPSDVLEPGQRDFVFALLDCPHERALNAAAARGTAAK